MKNWDRFIRINHWLVALLFFFNYFEVNSLVDTNSDVLHQNAGYIIAALIGVRLLWALIGPINARLSQFFPTPQKIWAHLKLLKQHKWQQAEQTHNSHNPLGALMVLFLWSLLLACAATGYMQEMHTFWGEEWVQQLHELLATYTLAAVTVHVTAVLITQKLSGKKLVRAMLWRN